MFGLAVVFATARWDLMLRLGHCAVHPVATLRAVLIGHFFNTLLFGPAGGDVAKSMLYSRWYGHAATEVMATCALDRLLGGGGLIVFIVLGLGATASSGATTVVASWGEAARAYWLLVVFVLAATALGLLRLQTTTRNSPAKRTYDAFRQHGTQLLASPWLAAQGLLLGLLSQAAGSAVLALCLQAVSTAPLSWAQLLWAFPLIALSSAVPSVSGAGVRDGAALVLLGSCGIPAADAVAASLLTLVVYLCWFGLGGVLWWVEERRLRSGSLVPAQNPNVQSARGSRE
jgi:hypothetical protein